MARNPYTCYALAMSRLTKWFCGMVLAAGMPLAGQVAVLSGQVNYQGTSVPYAPIQVCVVTSTGTPCTPTASLYSDYNLTHHVANPNTTDLDGNYTFYAAALPVPAFFIVQVTPQPGTTWSYVFSGASGDGCLGFNSIAYGCTGATTSQGAATNIVNGNSIAPRLLSAPAANVNGICSVTFYGAVGDCTGSGSPASCTNNHDAEQAAFDACYASGGSVFYPTNPANSSGQTVYYHATAVNPKGVSFFASPSASGASGYYPNQVPVAVRGAPGHDVFDVVDASLPGYVAPRPSFAVHDIGIIPDDSVDASASFPTRRPGRIAMDVVANGTAVVTSATAQYQQGDVGQATTVGATTTTIVSVQSATQATLATTISTATGLTQYISVMGLPVTQNIGNCAFAYDDASASYTGPGPSRAVFSDVMIQTTSNNAANHTCGFFFQGNEAPYQAAWRDSFVGATFPFAYVPASSVAPSTANWAGIGDYNVWDHVWMAGHYPIITYNGYVNWLKQVQISSALVGPHILHAYSNELAGPSNWTINIPEYEQDGGSCTSGLIGFRISGTDHTWKIFTKRSARRQKQFSGMRRRPS